jgi:hypothetical protein
MPDYLGFNDSSQRSRLAPFYARGKGATQKEIDTQAKLILGIDWEGKFNILDQADEWGHEVWWWYDPQRGKVYKINYNPNHRVHSAAPPPSNWEQNNIFPAGITPTRWHRRHR